MPIGDRNLGTGTVLRARHKGKERTCDVVHADEGLRYRLDDGTEHQSPSSAGTAAMGGVACNGWRFWSVAGTETAKRAKAKKVPAAKKSAKVTAIKPNTVKAVRAAASIPESPRGRLHTAAASAARRSRR